jgi:hypothetical protein
VEGQEFEVARRQAGIAAENGVRRVLPHSAAWRRFPFLL